MQFWKIDPPAFLGLRHLSHVDCKKKENHFSSFIVSNLIIKISGITITKVVVVVAVVVLVVVAVAVAAVVVATAMADLYRLVRKRTLNHLARLA